MNPWAPLAAGAGSILLGFFLVLFAFTPRNREHLYLAVACGLFGLSATAPLGLPWVGYLLSLVAGCCLWKSLYPKEFPRGLEPLAWTSSLALPVLVLTAPGPGGVVVGVLLAAWGLLALVGLVRARRRGRPDASVHLVGGALLALGIVGGLVVPFLPLVGLASALVVQIGLLSLRFWRLHRLNGELADIQKVNQRQLQELNEIYARFVPFALLQDLEKTSIAEISLGAHAEVVRTVLFSDIRDFTTFSESLTPDQTFERLNGYLGRIGPLIRQFGGFILSYQGDAILAVFEADATAALEAARAMHREVERCNQEETSGHRWRIGVGIHSAPLLLGVIGERDRLSAAVVSDAAEVAEELESLTKTLGVRTLVSDEAYQSLGDQGVRSGLHRLRTDHGPVLWGLP